MSHNRLVFHGLEELKADLRNLPAELASEASQIVVESANGAATEIVATYPERTRNLKRGVKVQMLTGTRFFVGAVVKNTAKHAWIFENGTQARHTALGANRGAMPAGRVFVPTVLRWRRRMYEQLTALLERHGLRVTGRAS